MNVTLMGIFQEHHFFLEGVAEGKNKHICSTLCFGAAEVSPGAEKRLFEESPTATMKLSPRTL